MHMAERRNFLLLAIGIGAAGVMIGTYTIYGIAAGILGP